MRERLPLLHHQFASPSAFRPEDLVDAVRAVRGIKLAPVPQICVLDFDGDLTDWLVKTGHAHPLPAWACFHTTMYSFEVDGVECGIIPRTIGGPYAVLIAEQLDVSGAQIVLGITSAGRVDRSLPVPCLIVATSAIRDEGTSYHYLPAAEVVQGPAKLAGTLYQQLHELGLPVVRGRVWTTDAPYRETEDQLAEHAANKVLAVEMQAASLFAFAQAKRMEVGVVAHVTNGFDHAGTPFDKGSDEYGWNLAQAMCRAAWSYLEP